jgi:hypothetical protein
MKQETKKTWVSPVLKDISLDKTNAGVPGGPGESSHMFSMTYAS